MAELVRQVGDLNDHFLALSWRLDLQEQTLTQKLCEVRLPGGKAAWTAGVLAPLWLPEGGGLTGRSQKSPVTICEAKGG